MKNSIHSKLASYSSLAISFIVFAKNSEGQIVYTDVVPDDTLYICDTLPIDLNRDGISDFILEVNRFEFSYWRECAIMNKGTLNQVAGQYRKRIIGSYSYNLKFKYPYKLKANDRIGNSLYWVKPLNFDDWPSCSWDAVGPDTSQAAFNYDYFDRPTGYWINSLNEGYAGLKIFANGKSYYGWARLVVDTVAKWMIVKDYAVDTIPDQSILAGQGIVTSSSNLTIDHEILFPNPTSSYFQLKISEGSVPLGIIAIDALGQACNIPFVLSGSNLTGNVGKLSKGMYVLEINFKEGVIRKKIIIE